MSGDVWYLDTSAFLKLVRRERHSAALRRFLADRRVVSSDLLRTEALRAARRQGASSVERVGELLTRLTLIRCDIPVFEAAGTLDLPELRSLDALHLAAALELGPDLAGIVTYDQRLAEACTQVDVAIRRPVLIGAPGVGTTGCDVRTDLDAERVVPSFRGNPPFPQGPAPSSSSPTRSPTPMPTDPAPTEPRSADPAPRPVPFDLRDGPLADALAAVEQALSDVETAKANVTAERHEFARTFRDQLVAHGDDPSVARDLQATIAQLYWDCSALRVTDLAAATGLGNDRIRSIAGPRVVDAPCAACGAPTQVLQTRRGDRTWGRCPDCRQPAADPYADGAWPPPVPPMPSVGSLPPGWLEWLCDDLELRLRGVGCDHQLTLTRRWAMREGVDAAAVIDRLDELGAFCDCEVLANADPRRDRPL